MQTNETLTIKNFAGIREASFDLSRINVFIGPQASGKSVCAKLLFYFKEVVFGLATEIASEQEGTETQITVHHRERFLKYFPLSSWGDAVFSVQYLFSALWITIERHQVGSSHITITYSKYYEALLVAGRRSLPEESIFSIRDTSPVRAAIDKKLVDGKSRALTNRNYFIPAGRNFFATIRSSIFTLLASGLEIDPFLVEFGRLYEQTRRFINLPMVEEYIPHFKYLSSYVERLVCGTYSRVDGNDYILTNDGRRIALEVSSSGQQEVLPLALMMLQVAKTDNGLAQSTVFVEEPETHLYPSAQREIIHLLSAVLDLSHEEASSQYVITTHSPYILSALNNLVYGGKIARDNPDAGKRVEKILGGAVTINPANVRAYVVKDGTVTSIIDGETELVKASALDDVSGDLAREFQALLDIEFGDGDEL